MQVMKYPNLSDAVSSTREHTCNDLHREKIVEPQNYE